MREYVACQVRGTYDLTSVVQIARNAKSPAESAEAHHLAALPEKWGLGWDASSWVRNRIGIGESRDLPELIHKIRAAVVAAESTQIVHRAILPEKSSHLSGHRVKVIDRKGVGHRVRTSSGNLAPAIDGK